MQRAAHPVCAAAGGMWQMGGCCNPAKPAMCAAEAQKAAAQSPSGVVPSGGAGAVSAALGLFGAALAAAFV
jgi:hypothetical protein